MPSFLAETLNSFRPRTEIGSSGFSSTAREETLGAMVLRSSSRLPLRSTFICERPVTLPPGHARLATMLVATGSPAAAITIGMLLAAFLAAKVSLVTEVTITSTLSAFNSAISAGSWSFLPSA